MKNILIAAMVVIALLTGCSGGKMEGSKAVFKTTAGDFTVELFKDKAPGTVGNFVNLTRK